MINEQPEKNNQLEADLEQQDLWYGEWYYDDLDEVGVTHTYQQWRQTVRNRGFRFFNMLSNKDTRVITVMFRRFNAEEKTLCTVHQSRSQMGESHAA